MTPGQAAQLQFLELGHERKYPELEREANL